MEVCWDSVNSVGHTEREAVMMSYVHYSHMHPSLILPIPKKYQHQGEKSEQDFYFGKSIQRCLTWNNCSTFALILVRLPGLFSLLV